MLKKITLLLCCAVAALTFCSCSDSKKANTFTVGFDAEFPPYGYVEKGVFKGFDLDLAREVAKRNNWKLVLKPINWDSKDMELNSGSIDCIWNGFTINGREKAPHLKQKKHCYFAQRSYGKKSSACARRSLSRCRQQP